VPEQHIMYVDDDESLVFLATRILQRQGYRVTGHSSATAALAELRMRAEGVTAVIADLSMPELGGIEFAREVASARPDVRVVLVSGHVDPKDNEVARALGVGDIVLKPHTVSEFAEILHSRVQRARPGDVHS
jgi:DNA-binding NtrC family response regulator